MRLESKTALITGAGSGIGRALAIEGARRGLCVALAGRRASALQATAEALAPGTEFLIIPGDITKPGTRRMLRERLAREWGQLDFLVNNAGIISAGPLAEARDHELEQLVAINLVAPIALTRELLPLLRAAGPARVVNIGSMLGELGFPVFAAYSASKFGLRGFSMALRRELRCLGIGVTYVVPGATLTDATRAIEAYVEPFEKPLDHPDAVARRVWNAVSRGADTVYPRGSDLAWALLQRVCPALVDRAVASQLDQSGIRSLIQDATPRSEPQTLACAAGPARDLARYGAAE